MQIGGPENAGRRFGQSGLSLDALSLALSARSAGYPAWARFPIGRSRVGVGSETSILSSVVCNCPQEVVPAARKTPPRSKRATIQAAFSGEVVPAARRPLVPAPRKTLVPAPRNRTRFILTRSKEEQDRKRTPPPPPPGGAVTPRQPRRDLCLLPPFPSP